LPSAGDTVVANGFTVTIDTDVAIGGANNVFVNAGSFVVGQWYQITFVGTTNFISIGATANTIGIIFQATGVGSGSGTALTQATIQTLAGGAGVAGGGFTFSTTRTITADVRSGTTPCLTFTGGAGVTASIFGFAIGGSAASSPAISCTGSGTLNFTGNASTGSGTNSPAVGNYSTGTTNITGNAIGVASGARECVGNYSTGSIVMTGNVIANLNVGITNNSTGSVTLTGTAYASTSNTQCLTNATTGTFTVIGSLYASSTMPCFLSPNASAVNKLSVSTYDAANGTPAIYALKYFLNTSLVGGIRRLALDGVSTFQNFYTADYSGFGQASTADVRSGVSYAAGALTGTAAIPAPANVALGIPVDATTGTAVLTAANVQTALTSQGLTTTRAANLDNLDAAVSSRLESSAYTAPANSDIAAIKVKTDANLDAAVSSRSTLTKQDIQSAVIPLL
jgi:hypothetical protein